MTVARSLGKLRNKTLATAFGTWNERVRDAKRAKYLIVSIMQRHYYKVVLKAFVHYKDWTVCKRTEDLADCRRQTLLKRFTARMVRKTELMAFSGWITAVKERVCNRVRVSRSLGRLCSKTVAAAFYGWRSFVDVRKQAQKKIVTIIKRRINSRTFFYLIRWKSWCTTAQAQERDIRRKELLVKRAVGKIQHKLVASFLLRWRTTTKQR